MSGCNNDNLDESYIWFYWNQGFSIIPLGVNKRNDLKAPSIDSWKEYHQRQPRKEEIQEWINQKLFKNIGVICGKVSGDLVVIDIDDESIPKTIGIKLDKIAETGAWIVKTGKGYHIYCKHHSNPGGINKPLKYKVEYRANRGYVAAPPSIHPNGNKYQFLNIEQIEELPLLQVKDVKSIFQDFKEKIGKAWNIKETKHTVTNVKQFNNKEVGYPACVEAALNQITKHPMRYYTIYGIASAFYFNKIPKDMAMQRIKQFNMKQCVPPHENSIVEQAVHGAYQPEAKRYGCEFWIDQAELCPYESIEQCPYGHKKIKRELARKYKIFRYAKTENNKGEKILVRVGVIYPNLGELIYKEYDFNFITMEDNQEIYYYKNGLYHPQGENIIRAIAEEYMEHLSSKHGKNEVEDHIRDKNYQKRSIFNAPKHLVNLRNGIFNLRTQKLIPHNPKYYFINELPIEYDADADCPKIKKFLSEVIKKHHIPVLQEFIGYCLLRDYPYHKAVMFLGAGKNGKSVTIDLIKSFLGEENTSNKELQELSYDRFASSKLYGKLLNAAADISSVALQHTGKFKTLTGNDATDGQKKFKDSFSFKNYAKLLYSANTLPKTDDDSYAFYRRWLLINFPYTFTGNKCDPHLLQKLNTPEELSGLFNWAVKGLYRLQKNNGFSYTKTVEQVREQYKTLSDPVYSFVHEFLSTNTADYLLKDDVYEKYVTWSNEKELPITPKNMFSQDLCKHLPNVRSARKKIKGCNRQQQVYDNLCWKKNDDGKNPVNPATPSQQEGYF